MNALRLKTLDRLPFNWQFALVALGTLAMWGGVIWLWFVLEG